MKGLQDVRKNLGMYGIKQLHNSLEEAAEGKRMDEAIHALGEAYVAFVRKHSGLYEATFLRDEEVRKAGDGIVKLCLHDFTTIRLRRRECTSCDAWIQKYLSWICVD